MTTYQDLVRVRSRYGRPSFLRGFASALDLFGSVQPLYSAKPFSEQNDAEAIAMDWQTVGKDLRDAFERAGCK